MVGVRDNPESTVERFKRRGWWRRVPKQRLQTSQVSNAVQVVGSEWSFDIKFVFILINYFACLALLCLFVIGSLGM